jgi:hypothetical protein
MIRSLFLWLAASESALTIALLHLYVKHAVSVLAQGNLWSPIDNQRDSTIEIANR